MDSSEHKALVREEFTRQADAYASSATITNAERIARLVEAVNPDPNARVLEVATGPGYVVMGFAARVREAVGVDLTEAPIAIARRVARERGVTNVRFEVGDAENLALHDEEFDVVASRFAFHHFAAPERVLAEMVRVCRHGGMVAIDDLVSSEHSARAEFYNNFERLRDPSHTRALPVSELLAMIAAAGLELEHIYSSPNFPELEKWLDDAQTPPAKAAQVRKLIERDAREDLSGARPFRDSKCQWRFIQHCTALIARRL